MPCNRCGMENERTDVVCISCGVRLARPARVPGAVCSSGLYTVRRDGATHALPIARYRAKRGFAVAAGALPRPPVQTDSAATPPRALSRRPRQPDLPMPQAIAPVTRPQAPRPREPQMNKAPAQAAPKPAPVRRTVPRPAAPVRMPSPPQRPAAPVQVRRPAARPAQVQRRPGPRRGAPSHPILTGSMVVAGLLLGMGGTWWATMRGIDPMMLLTPARAAPAVARQAPATPPLAAVEPAVERTPDVQVSPEPPQQQSRTPAAAADTGEPAAAAVDNPTPAPAAEPAAAQPSRPASRGTATRQAKKRSAPVAKQDRSEEIDRLRTQAFSETRKDRVGRISGAKPAARMPISATSSARLAGATRRAFSECDNSPNILRREQCRWKVCGGRWGRNGCPSYEVRQASLN